MGKVLLSQINKLLFIETDYWEGNGHPRKNKILDTWKEHGLSAH